MALNFILECDESIDDLIITNKDKFDDSSCSNTIEMKSKYACERPEYLTLYKRLGISIYIISIIFITVGIFLSLFGAMTFIYSISGSVFIFGGILILGFLIDKLPNVKVAFVISFSVSFLIGIICIFLYQVVNVIGFLLAGYFITQILFGILIVFIDIGPLILLFLLLISIYIIVGLLTYFIKGLLQILSTSSIGSYLIIRGFGFIIGGFPDEGYVSTLIRYREIYQLKRIILNGSIIYIITIFVFMIISMIIQFYTYMDENENKDENEPKKRRKSLQI